MNYGNYGHRPSHRILLTILSPTLRHRHYALIPSSHGTAGTVLVFESLAVLERMRMCRTNTYRTFLSLKPNATLPDTVDTIEFLNSSHCPIQAHNVNLGLHGQNCCSEIKRMKSHRV